MKEIELLQAIFLYDQKQHQAGIAWNFLETPIQVLRGASILYFNTLFFFFCEPLFFEDILTSRLESTKW